ncbi:GntR family transcriptional regulator [Roseovarius sp. E0-M6]|uniref:GntR family transcriptional regulator n=1 Tax=Roseovarius sp. E0-M6 TaxID=3127118 RepID=UPI00300FD589
MTRGTVNTVDTAYERLRDKLVAFDVKPGSRLNESEIAADLSMSRAPIREALNRLTADGMVSFEPGRGFFCRRLSVSEITDLYDVRLDLEIGALKTLLQVAAEAELNLFVEKWRADLAQSERMKLGDLVVSDEEFHLEMAALAGNSQRLKYLRNINDRIRFVRKINLESPERYGEALEEHASLLQAIVARDAEKAVETLSNHLARSTDEVRQQVQSALTRIYSDEMA